MSDDEKFKCTFEEHFPDIRGLGLDVHGLREQHSTLVSTTDKMAGLLDHVDGELTGHIRDMISTMKVVASNLEQWNQMAQQFFKLAKLGLIAILLLTAALVSTLLDISLEFEGVKIRRHNFDGGPAQHSTPNANPG